MSKSTALRSVQFGRFHDSIPVPHEPRDTALFPAGDLTLGVEYRVFDPAVERAKLTPAEVAAAGEDSLFHRDEADEGLCIHVFLTDGMREVLRFDCFGDEPHYHYISPGEGNVLVHYDRAANGPMLAWTIGSLRHHIDSMLGLIAEPTLTQVGDQGTWQGGLDAIVEHAAKLGFSGLV